MSEQSLVWAHIFFQTVNFQGKKNVSYLVPFTRAPYLNFGQRPCFARDLVARPLPAWAMGLGSNHGSHLPQGQGSCSIIPPSCLCWWSQWWLRSMGSVTSPIRSPFPRPSPSFLSPPFPFPFSFLPPSARLINVFIQQKRLLRTHLTLRSGDRAEAEGQSSLSLSELWAG